MKIYMVSLFHRATINKIWMVYPVSCNAVCYVTIITLFIKKVGPPLDIGRSCVVVTSDAEVT